jgi:NADPH2:quinone reductase
MKAILVREFGGPDVLKLEEVPTPKPAAGEVLVRIHAAGVNPYDTYMRAGTYARKPPLPYTPGSDGAGVVEAVGEGVKKVQRGDRVYTTQTLSGAYAEFALALEQQVHLLPAEISFSQGAGVWVPGPLMSESGQKLRFRAAQRPCVIVRSTPVSRPTPRSAGATVRAIRH